MIKGSADALINSWYLFQEQDMLIKGPMTRAKENKHITRSEPDVK